MLSVSILFYFLLTVGAQRISGNCQTPDNEPGLCLVAQSCKQMLDILRKLPRPFPPHIRAKLEAYKCVIKGKKNTICCPTNPVNYNQFITNGNSAEDDVMLPDVSNHKNVKFLPKNCGHLDTVDKIVNGNKTGLFEFPWMALLSYQTDRGPSFLCGGTIINENYILTAAHCVTNIKPKLIGVRVGEHDIRTNTDCEEFEGEEVCAPPVQDLSIEKVIFHKQYDIVTHANDIALVRVSPINLSLENSRPVCLPLDKARNFNFTNKNVVVTGWGHTEKGVPSPELLKVEVPIVSFEECRNKFEKIVQLTKKQICAGGKSKSDSCSGDSGGPLHVFSLLFGEPRFVQQGIVSFGPKDCGNVPFPVTVSVRDKNRVQVKCPEKHNCVPLSQCEIREADTFIYPCHSGLNMICCPHGSHNVNTTLLENRKTSLFPVTCGLVMVSDKVSGGKVADLGQFPWMALLGYRQKGLNYTQFLCAGSIITDHYILTAAHCINLDRRLELVLVRLGEHDLLADKDCFTINNYTTCAPPHVDFTIQEVTVHKQYNTRTIQNDIALIKVRRQIRFTEYIKPICLPFERHLELKDLAKQKLTISGWGKTNAANLGGSTTLQYTSVSVWNHTACKKSVPPEVQPIQSTQICANGPAKEDACKGDSGGPLFLLHQV
ncbi:Transmembrane protease serine 9-like Protein [Tribolium castaneum]|uniref:Transmembrane protease serine 9-like Protein n=1 Tax=Tribolium castaneum TaxID=7070 RepID=A0A139WF86_TRICA|nr:Transmembrane protease serine 9-like Protein [Tribolium castaneum]